MIGSGSYLYIAFDEITDLFTCCRDEADAAKAIGAIKDLLRVDAIMPKKVWLLLADTNAGCSLLLPRRHEDPDAEVRSGAASRLVLSIDVFPSCVAIHTYTAQHNLSTRGFTEIDSDTTMSSVTHLSPARKAAQDWLLAFWYSERLGSATKRRITELWTTPKPPPQQTIDPRSDWASLDRACLHVIDLLEDATANADQFDLPEPPAFVVEMVQRPAANDSAFHRETRLTTVTFIDDNNLLQCFQLLLMMPGLASLRQASRVLRRKNSSKKTSTKASPLALCSKDLQWPIWERLGSLDVNVQLLGLRATGVMSEVIVLCPPRCVLGGGRRG